MKTPEEFLSENGLPAAAEIDRQGLLSAFLSEMEKGLRGEESSLRMIPAYVGVDGKVEPGAKAAVLAGYKPERASATACDLRARPRVRARLRELELELREESDVTREQIIAELKAIAFSNVADCLPDEDDPQMILPLGEEFIRALPARPRHVTAAIESVMVGKDGIVQVRRWDKVRALSKLAEILGMTQPEVSVNVSMADAVSAARERAGAVPDA